MQERNCFAEERHRTHGREAELRMNLTEFMGEHLENLLMITSKNGDSFQPQWRVEPFSLKHNIQWETSFL
jgi:hypothetical protein